MRWMYTDRADDAPCVHVLAFIAIICIWHCPFSMYQCHIEAALNTVWALKQRGFHYHDHRRHMKTRTHIYFSVHATHCWAPSGMCGGEVGVYALLSVAVRVRVSTRKPVFVKNCSFPIVALPLFCPFTIWTHCNCVFCKWWHFQEKQGPWLQDWSSGDHERRIIIWSICFLLRQHSAASTVV